MRASRVRARLSLRLPNGSHPISIDSRIVRAARADDSAVAPSAPSILSLEEGWVVIAVLLEPLAGTVREEGTRLENRLVVIA